VRLQPEEINMKKAFVSTVLLLLVLGGGAYYLYTNLDFYVKQQIEAAGTAAVGTAVTVESVEINVPAGTATVRGFRVANPEGYSASSMMSFEELHVALDLNNISRERVGVTAITARNPHILYEMQGNVSNLDIVRGNLAGQGRAPAPQNDESGAIQLEIASVDIEEIGATLSSNLLTGPVEVELGDIALRDLRGTPTQIADQIMQPLISQLSANAGRALLSARAGDLGDEVLERVDAGLEAAGEALRETGATIREGLGNIFSRDDDEEQQAPAQP
jgi:hypothetical protein